GGFLILATSILFSIRKKWSYAVATGAAGILPLLIIGIISLLNGWFILPNPILLKGNIPDFSSTEKIIKFFTYFAYNLAKNPHILVLISISLGLFILQTNRKNWPKNNRAVMNMIFIIITLLHLQFGKTGWFYRYEAYLMALGLFVIAAGLQKYLPESIFKMEKRLIPKYAAVALLILTIISPLAARAFLSLVETPQATKNIHEQQYQMGLFVKEFYNGKSIAANDIGAIDFLADVKIVDLWGIGSLEIAMAKRGGYYNAEYISSLAKSKNVKFAVVYDKWFNNEEIGGLPQEWVKLGEWKIIENVVCADDAVSFYGVDSLRADTLLVNLKNFSNRLPPDVIQSGKYTE
ncbi:MAG: hypothetical protein ACE5QV_03280, partial [Fidelibacterota bacterium]